MDKPFLQRPPWVIPSSIYTFTQPELIVYPPTQSKGGAYYRQQAITNATNTHWNKFSEPLRIDLVHHSKTTIPLVPTGQPLDLDLKYLVETIFEPERATVSVQLRDPVQGRLVKLDLRVTDT